MVLNKIILTKNQARMISDEHLAEADFPNIKIIFLPHGGVSKMDGVSNTSFKLPAM